jgi:Zn-dependent protease
MRGALFRFRLLNIPVEVHPTHLLISGLIAWSFTQSNFARTAWPTAILRNDAHPQYGVTVAFVLLAWMLLVTLSVLVHELGHATAARAFGTKPSIHLVGLGGLTRAEGAERFEWWRDVLFTLAGPAAGLALGVLGGLVVWLVGDHAHEAVRYFGMGLLIANVSWTVLNLLPISTLDGGRIAAVLLTRALGRPGFLIAQVLALVFAGGVLLWAFATQQAFLGFLVVMLAMRTFANIGAYQRGELPLGFAAHPLQAVVERAEELYRQRKLPESELVAREVADAADAPVTLRSRAHVLLGWIALKEGSGRRALDHFSQVQGLEVPPQALAAGFSLIGDEARAIPLWAQAAQTQADDVVLHEFAGALIRGGREKEARAVPGVRMAHAFAAAERVFFVRNEFEQAAHMAEAAFREEPQAVLAYDAACAWARAGQPESALRMLTLAAQNGFADAQTAASDPDLASLRGREDFREWLAALPQTARS